MTIFRWVLGAIAALLFTGSVFAFVIFITMDIPVWIERARSLKHGAYLACLLWFNVEVWGRVFWILLHWS